MRLDELPQSHRVEDRRAQGGMRVPGGRAGGIGIGTIIVLGLIGWATGIDPSILIRGADTISKMQPPPASEPSGPGTAGAAQRSDGRVRLRGARRHGNAMEEDFREYGKATSHRRW